MQIHSSITLINNVYHVQVGPRALDGMGLSAFTPVEQEALAKVGEPVVACGGTFTTEGLEFTMDADDRYFPSQFPVKKLFSVDDYDDDAPGMAVLFRDTIKTRMTTAMENIRIDMTSDATGSEIDDIDTTPTP